MRIQKYGKEARGQALQYGSSDALLLFVCDAIHRRLPLSTVRLGDGERCLIEYVLTGTMSRYLMDPIWLKEYGLYEADLQKVGRSLLNAAKEVDYLCPNISGLTLPKYEIISVLPPRERYYEGLYAHTWLYMGRVKELMDYPGGVGIVCRNSKEVADRLFMKFGRNLLHAEHTEYGSWRDYPSALEAIGKMKTNLVLVSAGPSGKYLCVEASKKWGKVVLDTGSALVRHWSVSKSRNI